MTAERWQQIKDLLHAASEREAAERGAWLAAQCGDDVELRQEVESLLALNHASNNFMRSPLMESPVFPPVDAPGELMPGQSVGPYLIERRIGAGGMGVVYCARDSRLERPVALKLLPSAFMNDAERLRRFRQEARAISTLNHPNILTIYEIGQAATANGMAHFIATEFVEGRTLRAAMKEGGLTLGLVLDVMSQTATALAAAHQAGVVHRDIKPENLMLRPDGVMKVLDFGLAKLTISQAVTTRDMFSTAHTQPGLIMGTVSYMSPEQARGLEVDARSDIFSLGVVLYELLTGQPAFAGATTGDVLVSILDREPAPLKRYAPDLPVALQAILNRTLAKDCAQRYQQAAQLHAELKDLHEELKLSARLKRAGETPTGHVTLSLPVGHNTAAESAATTDDIQPVRGLAVLPFRRMGADNGDEYLGLGLADALITRLSHLQQLRVRPTSAVARFAEADPIEAGRALRVESVLTGSHWRGQERLRVTVQMVSVTDEAVLWAEQFDEPFADIFAIQDSIAARVTKALSVKMTAEEQSLALHSPTTDPLAYQLFLQGRYHFNQFTPEHFQRGIACLQQALTIDARYAPAYVGLAGCYIILSAYGLQPPRQMIELARREIKKARALDARLPSADGALAVIHATYDWDFVAAEAAYRRALTGLPNDTAVRAGLAGLLSALGRDAEALRELHRAQEIDPFSIIVSSSLELVYLLARRYDEASAACRQTLAQTPHFLPSRLVLAMTYAHQQRWDEAVSQLDGLPVPAELESMCWGTQGYVYARAGRTAEAHAALALLLARHGERYISAYQIASVYAGLDDSEETLNWLERAYDERAYWLMNVNVDPRLDGLRGDARFTELVRRIGFVS